jgi:hypothetical protein
MNRGESLGRGCVGGIRLNGAAIPCPDVVGVILLPWEVHLFQLTELGFVVIIYLLCLGYVNASTFGKLDLIASLLDYVQSVIDLGQMVGR